MAYIRRELNEDMQQVVRSARTLADWHYSIRTYPWPCVGVAALLGYLVVPRRLEIHSPDEKTLEKLAKKHRLVIDEQPKPKTKSGPIAAAFSFVAALALKQATTLLGQQVAMIFEQQRAKNRRDPGRAAGHPGYTPGHAPGHAPGRAPGSHGVPE
jgi:hypothetical protein